MNLSNAVYDKLKFFVQVLIPGFAALYLGAAQVWGGDAIPNSDNVAKSCVLIATFLGLFLTASAKQYEGAGDLVMIQDDDGDIHLGADLNKSPHSFKNKKNVVLNVRKQELPNDDAA